MSAIVGRPHVADRSKERTDPQVSVKSQAPISDHARRNRSPSKTEQSNLRPSKHPQAKNKQLNRMQARDKLVQAKFG